MTTAATSGIGVAFKRDATAIADIESINWSGITQEMIDVTTLDSTSGFREFIKGFKDSGQIALGLNFVRDEFENFRIDYETTASVTYSIELADAGVTTMGMNGHIQDMGMSSDTRDAVKATVVIKITGVWTLTS